MNKNVRVFKDSLKRGNAVAFGCIAVLVSGGLFLLWLYIEVTSGGFSGSNGGIRFKGKGENLVQLMVLPALGLIAFASVLFLYLLFQKIKRSFELHPDKIVSKYKNKEETSLRFDQIKEVYRCRTLGRHEMVPYGLLDVFAYRESKDAYWKVIRPVLYEQSKKLGGRDLIQVMIEKYVEANIDDALNALEQGKCIEFDYLELPQGILVFNKRNEFDRLIMQISEAPLVSNKRTEEAKHYQNASVEKIILTKNSITIDGNRINFEENDELAAHRYELGSFIMGKPLDFEIGRVLTISNNGIEKAEIDLTRLANADLFLEIMKNLIR